MRPVPRLLAIAGLLGAGAVSRPALAGWYIMPSAKWATFSLRPTADEDTPNYYAYGGALSFGYSPGQVVDFGLFGSYLPGTLKSARFGKEDASLVSYGGELAARLFDSVYIGAKAGMARYQLMHTLNLQTGELPGRWDGPCGGLSLGAVHKVSKQSFFHTTLDFMHAVLKSNDGAPGKRGLDTFSVSISYMFNASDDFLISNTIFKDFLDSITFL